MILLLYVWAHVRVHTNSISRRTHGARDEYYNMCMRTYTYLFLGKFSPRPLVYSTSRSPHRMHKPIIRLDNRIRLRKSVRPVGIYNIEKYINIYNISTSRYLRVTVLPASTNLLKY